MREREIREREFYNKFAASRPAARSLLDRFSSAFYEKGSQSRLWSPFWNSAQLQGATVLDYGCGNGEFSAIVARRGARVVGIDISITLIAQARRASVSACNGNPPIFTTGDAHRLPFGDARFDYVVGNGALHHLDLNQAFAEIARVLKPGGLAAFMEPMQAHPLLWTLRRLTPSVHTSDERPLTIADIERARPWFSSCSHRQHYLLAVCAAPAHLLGKRFALSVINPIDRFDGFLMRRVPALRCLAWLTMIEMQR